ncbi:MAG: sensor histidine kinase, partial [Halobacterium sp.]
DLVTEEVERARSNYPDVEFESRVEADVDVDARVRLAVRELLVNAVEHNDTDDPRVTVEATDGSDPAVRVSDNGSGIPEHERRALAGVEEAPLRHGSGIGLWVVYWLTRQFGATVDTEDESTVVVHFPDTDH